MSNPLDIISMFNIYQESYTPIVVPQTDNNMFCPRDVILTILYSISLGADTGCPSGLILTDAAYKHSLGTTVVFDYMIGAYKLYDPSIEDDAANGIRKHMEREYNVRLATQLLIRACRMGCRSLIFKFVKATWVRHLQDSDSFYTRVSQRDILNLLAMHSGGLEHSKFVAMLATMHLWWAGNICVPEFINILDHAQNQIHLRLSTNH